jgi:hypothetical protein
MASSTLRCGHARCVCCCSQKPLPVARTMSATSRVGRLLACSSSWNASLRRDWTPRWLPADWESPADGAGTDADRGQYQRSWHGREEPGWCAGRRPPPADALQSNAVRHPRTTHDLHAARICYHCHPFYGIEVEVIRHLRRMDSEVLIVRLPTGAQIALPKWMLIPELCDRLSYEDRPRVGITALLELRRIIDDQRMERALDGHGCAESASGGQDAEHQGESDRAAAQAAVRGRGDLDRASGIHAGTLPRAVAPAFGKRSQQRRREAK